MNSKQSSELLRSFAAITENERAWVGFLRLITNDMDPAPTLARVQALRTAFSDCSSSRKAIDSDAADEMFNLIDRTKNSAGLTRFHTKTNQSNGTVGAPVE